MQFLLHATSKTGPRNSTFALVSINHVKELSNAQKLTAHKYFIWNYVR